MSCHSSTSVLFSSSLSSTLSASLHPSRLRLFSCQYHVWKVSLRVSLGLVNLSAAARLKGRLLAREGQEHLCSHGAFFSLWTHGCCFRHVLYGETTSLGTCEGPRGAALSVTPVCDEDLLYNKAGVLVVEQVLSNTLQVSVQTHTGHMCRYLRTR